MPDAPRVPSSPLSTTPAAAATTAPHHDGLGPGRIVRRAALVVAALATLLATALVGPPALAYPPDPPPAGTSATQLNSLTVRAAGSMDGYSRDLFPHWRPVAGNCNTREEVLKRDGSGVVVGNDCYPTSGSWYSVYDQVWLEDPAQVSIDHMVPLANAWRHGASSWSAATREAFANDLSNGQLIAVSASSNSSKGDRDPSQWRPANTGWWCFYSRHWIDVKHDYSLSVTAAEKTALTEMLATC